MNFLTFLSRGTLILNRCNTDRLSLPTQKHSKSKLGVLIERAPYYTIFVGGVRTIRECALTEVVRYVCLDYWEKWALRKWIKTKCWDRVNIQSTKYMCCHKIVGSLENFNLYSKPSGIRRIFIFCGGILPEK